jgi:aerobic-type carbon monoxide dehydrogenase small subunit (CoxS/CutS family)
VRDPHLLALTVNDEEHEVVVEPRRTLADVLRHDLLLTGTHVGCEHGVCGACTVLLDDAPVRACLVFAVQAEGSSVRTVESLADHGELSDLQQAFSDHHGLQCGFCTPGFLMLAEGVLAEQPDASREEIREGLSANLCRCTGYQTIVDAVHATACSRRESAS